MMLEVTWSLSVEEQFYLVWPLLVRFVSRRVLTAALGGLVIAAPVFRHLIASGAPSLCHTLCRVDGLAFGCLAALWWFSAQAPSSRYLGRTAVGLWAALLFIIWRGGFQLERWGVPVYIYPLVPVATATTILAVLAGQARWLSRLLGWRAFVRIGRVSFGLYLLHPLAFTMTHQLAARFGAQGRHAGLPAMLLWGGLATCLSVAMAFASYQVWEQKFLGLKGRLDSARGENDQCPVTNVQSMTNVQGPMTNQ
jgi:peptidoglycan/LPS O-acetylase OafA/YrhL